VEIRRQLVHIAVGAFAFLLRDLTWWQAAMAATAAVLHNALILPRVAPALFRAGEPPLRSGIVIYPLAVLGLILAFPDQLEVAAAAWAILAAGDGAATLAGTLIPTRPLPWNPHKSWSGLIGFVVVGAAAGILLFRWTLGEASPPGWWTATMPAVAALVAGLVESAPIRLDDNISVPASAALVLWSLSTVALDRLDAAIPLVAARLPIAVGVNAVVAAAGWLARTVTMSGAITGLAIGVAIFVGAGWSGWAVLIASFVAAVAATQAGHARKAVLGIAEARGGRRGPGNAVANTGVAAWAALLSIGASRPDLATLAMTAALVAGAADTVASEIGKAWGRTTWLVTRLRPVPPGTSGAVSLEGTAGGALAAAALASLAAWLNLVPSSAVGVIVVAAVLASLVEGALGATFEASGILDNDALNLLNSLAAAGLAVLFWQIG